MKKNVLVAKPAAAYVVESNGQQQLLPPTPPSQKKQKLSVVEFGEIVVESESAASHEMGSKFWEGHISSSLSTHNPIQSGVPTKNPVLQIKSLENLQLTIEHTLV